MGAAVFIFSRHPLYFRVKWNIIEKIYRQGQCQELALKNNRERRHLTWRIKAVMKFSFVTIHVNHLEESIRFYEEILGLKVLRRFAAGPEKEIAFMGGEGAELELIGDARDSEVNVNEKISLGFEIASVEECMETLQKKGVPVLSGPFQPNPKTRFFFIQDPNGVMLELIEQN